MNDREKISKLKILYPNINPHHFKLEIWVNRLYPSINIKMEEVSKTAEKVTNPDTNDYWDYIIYSCISFSGTSFYAAGVISSNNYYLPINLVKNDKFIKYVESNINNNSYIRDVYIRIVFYSIHNDINIIYNKELFIKTCESVLDFYLELDLSNCGIEYLEFLSFVLILSSMVNRDITSWRSKLNNKLNEIIDSKLYDF